MAKKLTKVRVFVASPGDTQEERERLNNVIEELNRTVANEVDLVVELVKWETHSRPGVGRDAQDVINQQLAPCEIFIGIMWKRLGTPTLRAGSGTVEEFERAWGRLNQPRDKNAPLLFYFCTRPFFPNSEDDLSQMRGVLRFRRKLEKRGLLLGTYQTSAEFENKVHEHLTMTIINWARQHQDAPFNSERSRKEQNQSHMLNTTNVPQEIDALSADGITVGLIFLDLDGFTTLNDQYGREELDRNLQEIMRVVADAIEGRGELIHYFGDEFIVLLPNTSTGEAAATAERLRCIIENRGIAGTLKITASFGVSSSEAGQQIGMKLVRAARMAVFVSKLKGKNRVTTTPLSAEDEALLRNRHPREPS